MRPRGQYGRRVAVRGVVLYELVCTECGSLTPAVAGTNGCVDLDEQLVCGHDPIRRDVLVLARPAAVERPARR